MVWYNDRLLQRASTETTSLIQEMKFLYGVTPTLLFLLFLFSFFLIFFFLFYIFLFYILYCSFLFGYTPYTTDCRTFVSKGKCKREQTRTKKDEKVLTKNKKLQKTKKSHFPFPPPSPPNTHQLATMDAATNAIKMIHFNFSTLVLYFSLLNMCIYSLFY